MRQVRIVLWMLVVVVAAAAAGVYVGQTFLSPNTSNASGSLAAAFARSQYEDAGGPFTLINTDGETVSEQDFRGKPLAIFFGFTHCPDVCPTALLDMSGWLDGLGEDAERIHAVFVSVDPERDLPETLGRYVSAFDSRIVGLTAETEDDIKAIADTFKVRFEKIPLKNGSYTVNHTADTLLFDAKGRYSGFIPYLAPNMRQNEKIAVEEQSRAVSQLQALVGS